MRYDAAPQNFDYEYEDYEYEDDYFNDVDCHTDGFTECADAYTEEWHDDYGCDYEDDRAA